MNAINSLESFLAKRAPAGPGRPLDVCVVTSEILGPVKNGGIATATTGLIEQLIVDGHRVTILYTLVERGRPASGAQPWNHWVERYRTMGAKLEFIAHDGTYRDWRHKSWLVMDFLAARPFDLVYFNEHHGSGYYSIAAKRAREKPFTDQIHCVITHGSIEWVFDINDQYIDRPSDVEMMGMERRSVEWADYVIGPSRYILEKYREYGWNLPANVFHHPLPLFRGQASGQHDATHRIGEIVFFGRLETRKGLWLFCDAIDRLGSRLAGYQLTFLGRATSESGLASNSLMLSRAANWPVRLRMLNDFDQEDALAYLRKPGRLAVMPSLADNSPCVVYECMENGIPFLSTLGSGASELVHRDDWPVSMVQPDARALADRLREILDDGTRVARPSFSPETNLEVWSRWHAFLSAAPATPAEAEVRPERKPAAKRVGLVCIDQDCAISLLIRNHLSNRLRLGRDIRYLIVTARGGAIREFLSDALCHPGGNVELLDPQESEHVAERIGELDLAIFADARTEVSRIFLDKALELNGDFPAVTCVTAERASTSEPPVIRFAPSGDLPGLPFLGHPIGSSTWACAPSALKGLFGQIEYVDPVTDFIASSAEIGQQVMRACARIGNGIALIPGTGGVLTRFRAQRFVPLRRSRTVSARARALGIRPGIASGAPWFSMTSFGESAPPHAPIASVDVLDPAHPLQADLREPIGTSTMLAAATGRYELAFRLAAADTGPANGIADLVEYASDGMRASQGIDLKPLFSDPWQFGRPDGRLLRSTQVGTEGPDRLRSLLSRKRAAKQRAAGKENDEAGPAGNALPAQAEAYLDMRAARFSHGNFEIRTGSGPARIIVTDLPLAGHEALVLRLRAASAAISASIRLLDQQWGSVIAQARSRAASPEISATLDLKRVFLQATLIVEVEGEDETAFQVTELRLE